MPSFPTPIRAKPSDRDPLRNFKFRAQFISHEDSAIQNLLADMSFISIAGFGMTTDVIPYREGGDNTSMRKLPGQSDFSPLTLIGGVFMKQKNAGIEWMKQIYSLLWGQGNGEYDDDFRCDLLVSVLKHPVTKWSNASGPEPSTSAGMMTKFYNCWPASLQFNDLNAGDNSIMIQNMTIHHEGFQTMFGSDAIASKFAS